MEARRLERLKGHLGSESRLSLHLSQDAVRIVCNGSGEECVVGIGKSLRPELVPRGYVERISRDGVMSQAFLQGLMFLMKKDALGQDVFLLGPPGNGRRFLVLAYCELTNREVEYVSISQDTTVSDLKQRREIRSGSAVFLDGPAVRAATEGRMLVLEGVKKAERNILSVLNNLLENREMHLEDGRFLTNSKFTDASLVKVNEDFRVVALGLPVPEYEGNPMDPPFRSRFQAFAVPEHLLNANVVHCSNRTFLTLAAMRSSFIAAEYYGLEGVPPRMFRRAEFPHDLEMAMKFLARFPEVSLRFLVGCIYPYTALPWFDPIHMQLVMDIFVRHGVIPRFEADSLVSRWKPVHIDGDTGKRRGWKEIRKEIDRREDVGTGTHMAKLRMSVLGDGYTSSCGYCFDPREWTFRTRTGQKVYASFRKAASFSDDFVAVRLHDEILSQMLLMHEFGTDMCIIGSRGCGKSTIIRRFASTIGSHVFYFPLFKDMSSQDLLQRRTTTAQGDTVWIPSPLTLACMYGGVVVLDGLEQVPPWTLATLQSLYSERFLVLPDGVIFSNHPGSLNVHPDCRIIGVARPHSLTATVQQSWLTPEVNSMLQPFLWIRALEMEEEASILNRKVSRDGQVGQLLRLAHSLRRRTDDEGRAIAAFFDDQTADSCCQAIALQA
mmetsp:Transcript_34232/g.54834  ORF Transcript_34232/g.54834 Transcript_34232/m.54834 type:complete len:665 (-) Transcript_34232:2842-4836(-)